ncbi:MAG: DUF4345 domain-containing protein [Deltaproteobacteria bacterium]|nr:DUF4345 domain-containing protein [Deltaproteobacteria bacterium]
MRRALRRWVLAIAALVFLVIAIASSIDPHFMARPFDYELPNTNALNEYRAIYTGLFLAHAVVFVFAAWKDELPVLGDVGGLLVLGQVVGRVFSIVVDGLPEVEMIFIGIVELIGGVAILALRPPSARPG